MSEEKNESGDSAGELIGDEQLPEDLRPAEDNPLAEGPEDDDEQGGMDPTEQGTP